MLLTFQCKSIILYAHLALILGFCLDVFHLMYRRNMDRYNIKLWEKRKELRVLSLDSSLSEPQGLKSFDMGHVTWKPFNDTRLKGDYVDIIHPATTTT